MQDGGSRCAAASRATNACRCWAVCLLAQLCHPPALLYREVGTPRTHRRFLNRTDGRQGVAGMGRCMRTCTCGMALGPAAGAAPAWLSPAAASHRYEQAPPHLRRDPAAPPARSAYCAPPPAAHCACCPCLSPHLPLAHPASPLTPALCSAATAPSHPAARWACCPCPSTVLPSKGCTAWETRRSRARE